MIVPGEYIIGMDSAIVAAILAVAVAVSRTRERVARLEGAREVSQRDRPEPEK